MRLQTQPKCTTFFLRASLLRCSGRLGPRHPAAEAAVRARIRACRRMRDLGRSVWFPAIAGLLAGGLVLALFAGGAPHLPHTVCAGPPAARSAISYWGGPTE